MKIVSPTHFEHLFVGDRKFACLFDRSATYDCLFLITKYRRRETWTVLLWFDKAKRLKDAFDTNLSKIWFFRKKTLLSTPSKINSLFSYLDFNMV